MKSSWGDFSIRTFKADDQRCIEALHRLALEAEDAWIGNGPWDDDLRNIHAAYLEIGGEFFVGVRSRWRNRGHGRHAENER